MLLDLNKLHGQREHFERTFQPSVFDPPDAEYRVAAPVAVSMDVEKSGAGTFRVFGRALTRLEMPCSRCVEPFEVPVDARFELRYVPHTQAVEGAPEREIRDDDLTISYYREGALDVIEMLREQFQLALPMKPLCSDACRGLCPECGTNLNHGQCSCSPAWEDPRLAPLKSLLNRNKEN